MLFSEIYQQNVINKLHSTQLFSVQLHVSVYSIAPENQTYEHVREIGGSQQYSMSKVTCRGHGWKWSICFHQQQGHCIE